MNEIIIRNIVPPKAENETTVKLNFNVTFDSGVTLTDATVSIDTTTYSDTLPKDQPALIAKLVAEAFANYGE